MYFLWNAEGNAEILCFSSPPRLTDIESGLVNRLDESFAELSMKIEICRSLQAANRRIRACFYTIRSKLKAIVTGMCRCGEWPQGQRGRSENT